jgi:hypothetical protein
MNDRIFKMKNHKTKTSPARATAKNVSDRLVGPAYIREVAIGSDRLPIAIANGGFTAVAPGIGFASRCIMYLVNDLNVDYPIRMKDAFTYGELDATINFTSEDINNQFKIDDTVKILTFISYGEGWQPILPPIPYIVTV